MILATKNMMEIINRLDGMKQFLSSVKPENFKLIAKKKDPSAFPLFYAINSFFDGGIHNVEPEALEHVAGAEKNVNVMKTLATVFTSDAVWTNIFAFNALACVANNKEFKVGTLEELTAEEITWAVIIVGAVEGSMNLPFTRDVLIAMSGWLKEDGWTLPPLTLFFNNFCAYMDTREEDRKYVTEKFKDASIANMAFNMEKMVLSDSDKNYAGRNVLISQYIVHKIQELTSDWDLIMSARL